MITSLAPYIGTYGHPLVSHFLVSQVGCRLDKHRHVDGSQTGVHFIILWSGYFIPCFGPSLSKMIFLLFPKWRCHKSHIFFNYQRQIWEQRVFYLETSGTVSFLLVSTMWMDLSWSMQDFFIPKTVTFARTFIQSHLWLFEVFTPIKFLPIIVT